MPSDNIIRISEIINRKVVLKETLSPDDEMLLDEWLAASEDNKSYYDKLSIGEECDAFDRVVALSSQEKQWKRLRRRIGRGPRNKRPVWLRIGYAAAIVVAVGVSAVFLREHIGAEHGGGGTDMEYIEPASNKAVLVLGSGQSVEIGEGEQTIEDQGAFIRVRDGQVAYEQSDKELPDAMIYNTIRVPRKGVFSMVLSDGTHVSLSPDSELRYPVSFDGDTREVSLNGEAHFEVTHDPGKPFIVNAGDKKITVLGTSFVVSVYKDEPFGTASLLVGSIRVSNEGGTVHRVLTPGKQAAWKEGGQGISVDDFNAEHLMLSLQGIIVLEEKDVQSIMRMLSRWFDMNVDYDRQMSANHSITVRFTKQDNLPEILSRITKVGGPRFRIEGKTIHVY